MNYCEKASQLKINYSKCVCGAVPPNVKLLQTQVNLFKYVYFAQKIKEICAWYIIYLYYDSWQ